MSSPSSRTSPARLAPGTSSCMRLRIRRNVDLPQPDGPISAVTWPAGIVRVTSSSTWWSPNQAHTPSATSVAGVRPTGSTAAGSVSVWSWELSSRVMSAFAESSEGVGKQDREVVEDLPEDREQDRQGTDPQATAGAETQAGPGDENGHEKEQLGPQQEPDESGAAPMARCVGRRCGRAR